MGQAMEIDILEVRKRKNYYMLIFYWKFFFSFVYGAQLPKDLLFDNFIFLRIFGGFSFKKLKGGSEKDEFFCIFKFGYLQKKS